MEKDNQIKQAIRDGKSFMWMIKNIPTHSQRINRVKKEMQGEKYTHKQGLQESFIMNAY